MNWSDRIVRTFETDPGAECARGKLALLADWLTRDQGQSWPLMALGNEALSQAETRDCIFDDGSRVILQHNPRRIRSTAAAVDDVSVKARGCFLCPDALPIEEHGIAYGSDLIVLCNPFPVLPGHLSIVHREHVPQRIGGNLEALLKLTVDLGPRYFTLYNGPECGASAPDHLHFQACVTGQLPIEGDLQVLALSIERATPPLVLTRGGRSVIVFNESSIEALANMVYRALEIMGTPPGKLEPMINLICRADETSITLYLFPRAKHRPAAFFATGAYQILVSPGAVDMAGIVVVPEEDHFLRITPAIMEKIFPEVSLDAAAAGQVLSKTIHVVETT